MLVYFCAFALFSLATTSDVVNDESVREKVLGVDTVHEEKVESMSTTLPTIDKDTIITKNLKLTQRKKPVKPEDTTSDPDPDWTYSDFPPETKTHAAQFKQDMALCLKEVKSMDKRTVQRLSPNRESPVHGDCLIACVLKKNGVIRNKKINKDNLLTLVGKFFMKDSKLMKKLENTVDVCIEEAARFRDDCDMAAHLNACTNGLMVSNKHNVHIKY